MNPNPSPVRRLGALLVTLCITATSLGLPAAAALAADAPALPAPAGPAELLGALAAAREGPAPADALALPGPEEARALAEARLRALATPERLAATMAAVRAGGDVPMADWLVMGVLFHHAAPAYAGTPLGDLAAGVVGEAVALAAASGVPALASTAPADVLPCALVAPGDDPVAWAEACAAGAVPTLAFGSVESLGAADRVLRRDVLTVRSEDVFDLEAVTRSVATAEVAEHLAIAYRYSFQSWWFAYAYFYNFDRQEHAEHTYVEETLTRLYRYSTSFHRWELTQGVRVEVVAQQAPLPVEGAAARTLYAVVTPYAYLDHWWTVLAFEEFYRSVAHAESHRASAYWSETTSDYQRSGSTEFAHDEASLMVVGHTTLNRTAGYERLPFPEHPLLRHLAITLRVPVEDFPPLAREGLAADLSTAVHAALPHQTGVEYKDLRASEVLVTFPAFSDLAAEADTDPAANHALATVAGVQLAGAGGVAVLAAAPPGVALAGPTVPLLAAPAPGDLASATPLTWLAARYTGALLTTREQGAAGLGFLVPPVANPAGTRPIVVEVDALGLGLPVRFEVARAGGALVATLASEPAPADLAPLAALAAAAVDASGAPGDLAAMPWELSFPAFLGERGVLDGATTLEAAAQAELLRTAPEALAGTLARLAAGTSPEAPVGAADLTRLNALLYLAGPGGDADPAAQEAARALLAAAVGRWRAAEGTDAPAFGDAEAVSWGHAVLRHDARVTQWSSHVERASRDEARHTTSDLYVETYEALAEYESWSSYLYHRNRTGAGSSEETAAWTRSVQATSWYARVDTISGVTTLVLRSEARAEHDAAGAALLQTVVLPWRVAESAWLAILLDAYEEGTLRSSASWSEYYRQTVTHGGTTTIHAPTAAASDGGTLHVESELRRSGGRFVVPVASGFVAAGARIGFAAPGETQQPLPRDHLVDTSGVTGSFPGQLPTDREDAFAAEQFAVAPVPNEFRTLTEDDATVAVGTGLAEDGQRFAADVQADLEMALLDPFLGADRLLGRAPPGVAVPGAPAGAVVHEAAFAAEGFRVGFPAAVALALMAPASAQAALEPPPVRIVVTAQAAQGAGNFGGNDAFHLEHLVAGAASPAPPSLPALPLEASP